MHSMIRNIALRTACSLESLAASHGARSFAAASGSAQQASFEDAAMQEGGIRWVFLGPPGVGKGTYASRVAKHFQIPHIATGDLVRDEIKRGTAIGCKMQDMVNGGHLLTDSLILEVLYRRLEAGKEDGERGFVLDGFPRTRSQAHELLSFTEVGVALNLQLREEVLVQKCLGRRSCSHCGKGYNIADIHLAPSNGRPGIVMPPLSPPPECANHLETRSDDTEEVVRRRLQVYKAQAGPVEDFFRQRGLLQDFEITGGIPETLPTLMATLERWTPVNQRLQALLHQKTAAATGTQQQHSMAIPGLSAPPAAQLRAAYGA